MNDPGHGSAAPRRNLDPGRGSAAPRLLCPYREHTLISRQEHEAWDVLLACQGQLRLSPNGHVIGIDMGATLNIGAARGCELAALAELVPAAEAGVVEAIGSDRVRNDGL